MSDAGNIVAAFASEHVVRLTGLSMRQLAYWDQTGFFRPQHLSEGRGPYGRVYSFKDVVGLRTLSLLRGQHGVSLPHLRGVARKLESYSKTSWADIKLKVWNRKVQFDEPETGRTRGVVDKQYFLLPIADVIQDMRKKAEELRKREENQIGELSRHRYVAHNAPVIAGTRVRVEAVLHFLEDGYSVAAILKEYPTLTEADVEAVKERGRSMLAA